MRKIVTTFIAIILMLAMTACQATPDEVVVVEKDLDKMIEMASEPTASQEQTEPDEQDEPAEQVNTDEDEDTVNELALRMGAPDHYTDEFMDKTERLSVNVDAEVDVPDADTVGIYEVKKSEFTNEMAGKLIDALVHSQLYECMEDGVFFSKEGIMDYMMGFRALIAQMEDEDAKKNMESYMESIQYYYDAAPEEKTMISGEFEHKSYPNALGEWSVSEDVENIFGLAYSEEYGYETFGGRQTVSGVANRIFYIREPNSGVSVNGLGEYDTVDQLLELPPEMGFDPDKVNSIPDISITEEEAIEEADAMLAKIGEDDFSCYEAEKVYGGSWDNISGGYGITNPLRCIWRLRYVRTAVGGIPVTYTSEQGASSEEDEQASPWAYEDMVFHIDDSGIVGFGWVSPYEVTGTEVEDANVKSFDEIMDVFNTMIPVNYVWADEDVNVEITITQISFGLSRVTEENERDTGLLIPVWDFFGTCTYNTLSEDGEIISSDTQIPSDRSLLTINAIDGSVIDRGLGY